MRLIDADALLRQAKELYILHPDIAWLHGTFLNLIENMPTVEVAKDTNVLTNGWISVKDRLPERGRYVLVAVYGHDVIIQKPGESLPDAIERTRRTVRYVTMGFVDEDGWCGPDGYPMMVTPAYWQPLPEPPKEENV